jgi:thiamine pyrophosphokinase
MARIRVAMAQLNTVVGDLDSVAETAVSEAATAGTRVVRHPPEKDATDLELALDAAAELGPARILVLAGDGGRLDHLLATLLGLASPRYVGVQIDDEVGPARVHVVRNERVLSGKPGELVSLLALHGPAEGVRTEGLRYPLAGETLQPGSSRGISNVFSADTARVTLERGVLLAIHLPASERISG